MPLPLDIVLSQINPTVGDLTGNSGLILSAWKKCEGDLIVFPELSICGYPPEDSVLKPSFINAVHDAVHDLAAQSKSFPAAALIGAPWLEDGALYNAAILIHQGAILSITKKHHLPNYGVFDEKRIFTSAPLGDIVTLNGVKLGVMICEDLWFPDVSAHLKSHGAEILISLNASPYHQEKIKKRTNHAQARTAETRLPLLYVNQVGGQDELVFDGMSFAMNAAGEITAQAPAFEDAIIKDGDISPLPDQMDCIYRALVLGVRDYVTKNGFPGVVLGMSGGIDSALTAAIAVDALGADRVRSVMMPTDFTSADSLEDAKECAEALGISYEIIAIKDALKIFEGLIPNLEGLAHENIQSRIRGLILMALSNSTGHMVLSTGNKSEMAVGYATLYGDMNGGFNALKDVYKTQVYALSTWRNTQGEAPVIPERIITKAPTAELRDNQTDQDSLPDYDVLDTILQGLIEDEKSVADIAAEHGYDVGEVQRVYHMLNRAEYKRYQAPPGVKITTRAFGRDRRYPMTNGFKG